MKTNNQTTRFRNRKSLLLLTVCAALAVTVAGFLQLSGLNGAVAAAQKDDAAGRASAAMISYALTHKVADTEAHYRIMNQLPCQEVADGLSGKTLTAGVYCVGAETLARELTLDAAGDASAVFIFRVAGAFKTADGAGISLQNGALGANVHIVADSIEVAAGSKLAGNLLTAKAITISDGATLSGSVRSASAEVNAAADAIAAPAAPGFLEICKSAAAGSTFAAGRTFTFTIQPAVGATQTVAVQVGSCSGPIAVEQGTAVITETGASGTTSNTTGGFQLVDVNTLTTTSNSTLGAVNFAARTATVNVAPGDIASELALEFVNQNAITGFIEICKEAATNAGVVDPDVSGFFTFNIEGVFSSNTAGGGATLQAFTAVPGECTGAIAVTIPGNGTTGTVRVTELGTNPNNVSLESVRATGTTPTNREVGQEVLGSRVDENGVVRADNAGGGFTTVTVVAGSLADEALVTFVNRSTPGVVKVCKIAGPGIPIGTRFRFEVRGTAPSSPTLAIPGVDVIRTVDVPAGPAAQGGFCQFVTGTFITGTNVLVTETRALDPIPGSPATAARSEDTGSFNVVPVRENALVKNNVVADNRATAGFEPGTRESIGGNTSRQEAVNSPSALTPFVTESGKVTLSTDAAGSNSGTATLQVQKPAGATVRRAFLLAATIPGGGTISNTDITLNGTNVTFTQTVANNFSFGVVNNYRGEVTSIVKPTIDGAPAGLVNLTVTENNGRTSLIDGEILAVIFDDPNQTQNSVVLYFGALSTNGDTFPLNLVNPVDKTLPNFALDMSLGISFSFQGADQFSTVDVSTNSITTPARLTSSAGGQDDGVDANGALITAGGIGDSNANPPSATQTANGNPRYDDELYNLGPFVNNGDTLINVATNNPSDDDNVFFAGFFIGNNTLAGDDTVVLTPATAINPIGTSHTVTATVRDASAQPRNNQPVTFTVLSGPNAGVTGTTNTNASGVANFTYTSNGQAGTDSIQACIDDLTTLRPDGTSGGVQQICSNIVTKTWVDPFPSDVCVSRIRLNGSLTGFATAPATVQGITVNPNPNIDTRQAVFTVRRGVSILEFTNTVCRPATLKICKIAGSPSLVNQSFIFDVALVSPTGAGGNLLPAATTSVSVTAQSNANNQGGGCAFVDGSNFLGGFLNVGSTITITERAQTNTAVTAISSSTAQTSANTGGLSFDLAARRATLSGTGGLRADVTTNIVTFTNTATTTPPGTARPFDFDGDGKADLSTFTGATGTWRILGSSAGLSSVQFGTSSDKLAPADYDGDRKTDVAVYRPSTGQWFIQRSTDGFYAIQFGEAGDIAQPGDFDGDGKADIALFRPSNGIWYILGTTRGFYGMQFGASEDRPVAGDYDGDGKTDAAVYRPSSGTWYVLGTTAGFSGTQFGAASDRAVPADYDGDGKTDFAVYRAGTWYLQRSTAGFASTQFGSAQDRALAADFNGDGRADLAVYRDGVWFIQESGELRSVSFGTAADAVVPASFLQ